LFERGLLSLEAHFPDSIGFGLVLRVFHVVFGGFASKPKLGNGLALKCVPIYGQYSRPSLIRNT